MPHAPYTVVRTHRFSYLRVVLLVVMRYTLKRFIVFDNCTFNALYAFILLHLLLLLVRCPIRVLHSHGLYTVGIVR